jgi:hypothetical protein
MASFAGYVGFIIGLSLLLALAGVQTGSFNVIGAFMSIHPNGPTGGFSVDTSNFNKFGSPLLIAIFGIIAAVAIAGGIRSALGGSNGIAETIKTTALSALLALMIMDLVGIITYLNGVDSFGGVTKIVAFVIYIPLAVMAVISALDWIGGGK